MAEPSKFRRVDQAKVSIAEPTLSEWTKFQVPVDDALQVSLDAAQRIIIP
jgi:hypothetical protein